MAAVTMKQYERVRMVIRLTIPTEVHCTVIFSGDH